MMANKSGIDITATFQFVARYPVQMLIAGGVLLLLTGQIMKGVFGATETGAQTALWGWLLIVLGVIVFFGYLYARKR